MPVVAVGRMVGFGPKPHADPLVQVGHARVVDSDLGASKSDIRAIRVVTISERAGRTFPLSNVRPAPRGQLSLQPHGSYLEGCGLSLEAVGGYQSMFAL